MLPAGEVRSRESPPLLHVRDLRVHLPLRRGLLERPARVVRAVDGVSFAIPAGRTFGLVGESGCGKTTLARAVLRLIPVTSGSIHFAGTDVLALGHRELRRRRRDMQIVFQDPVGSLNPRMTVEQIVAEPLAVHGVEPSRRRRNERVAELLERVGLSADDMRRYPHAFSGGQRQRIGIARALSLRPRLIVCDEPVSALDVSVQAQVLNLLADLQAEFELTYLFIAHDLAVVRHFCDEVAVMYLGRIVEHGPAEAVFRDPRHPYTRALLDAVPTPDPAARRTVVPLGGEPPSPIEPPAGCPFHPRCPAAQAQCRRERPDLRVEAEMSDGHRVACPIVQG